MTRLESGLMAALAALIASCSLLDPRPDPSRFYVLTAVATTNVSNPMPAVSIGVGPISLPDYLQRQELMRRTSENEVKPSGTDRWAGALESNVTRVIAENLSRNVGTDRLWAYPSFEITRADYLVDISFVRFDLDTANTATLEARWEVRRKANDRSVSRETTTTATATAPDAGAGVEALSRTLGELTQDIAGAIGELSRGS